MRIKGGRKVLAITLVAIVILCSALGVIWMNGENNDQVKKIASEVAGPDGALLNYSSYINPDAKSKKFNQVERENLVKFIDRNIDILSGVEKLDDVSRTDRNIKVDLIVPKLSLAPVTQADLTYSFIVKVPTTVEKGVVGKFYGQIARADENSPWEYADIPMMSINDIPILMNFSESDIEKLKLKPEKRFFRDDLASGAEAINFSTRHDYKKFVNSNDNGANYAYYRYSTVRNGVKVSVVFGVKKAQYDEAAAVPSNWFYVYMKREG
ncbi:hypothetical protein [Chromobacterium amazonense]|uniref:Uncharacterized protein n=1 Tax=Chromobacterium amazonense TaxID=1382803 RepID=A0ABU8V8U4_9NEIS|nr:hypothetical protein [Chromobacterium amazonense]MDQ4539092.1 hypothetical protein [Chromobacterium amazonense]